MCAHMLKEMALHAAVHTQRSEESVQESVPYVLQELNLGYQVWLQAISGNLAGTGIRLLISFFFGIYKQRVSVK